MGEVGVEQRALGMEKTRQREGVVGIAEVDQDVVEGREWESFGLVEVKVPLVDLMELMNREVAGSLLPCESGVHSGGRGMWVSCWQPGEFPPINCLGSGAGSVAAAGGGTVRSG